MKRFIYKGNKYTSEYSLRQAIFDTEKRVYGKLNDAVRKVCGITEEEYNPEDEMTDEQLAARVRMRRDSMISRTDFYVQPDYPSDPEGLEAVKDYRQALRDIPEQSGFPRNVHWPEMPAVLSTGQGKMLGLAKVGI